MAYPVKNAVDIIGLVLLLSLPLYGQTRVRQLTDKSTFHVIRSHETVEKEKQEQQQTKIVQEREEG